MLTGTIESWGGTISDIGPMYPWVGSEFLLFIVGVLFWLVWQVVQIRGESKQWDDDIEEFGGKQLPRGEYDVHDY